MVSVDLLLSSMTLRIYVWYVCLHQWLIVRVMYHRWILKMIRRCFQGPFVWSGKEPGAHAIFIYKHPALPLSSAKSQVLLIMEEIVMKIVFSLTWRLFVWWLLIFCHW